MRIRGQVALDSIQTLQGPGEEFHGFVDALVGLGATEAQEAAAGLAEAFASQAGDAEAVVGRFEQVERQTVRGDSQAVADRSDIREDVEGAGRAYDPEAVNALEAVVLISLPIASTTTGAATAKPIRHPLMLYDLLKV